MEELIVALAKAEAECSRATAPRNLLTRRNLMSRFGIRGVQSQSLAGRCYSLAARSHSFAARSHSLVARSHRLAVRGAWEVRVPKALEVLGALGLLLANLLGWMTFELLPAKAKKMVERAAKSHTGPTFISLVAQVVFPRAIICVRRR